MPTRMTTHMRVLTAVVCSFALALGIGVVAVRAVYYIDVPLPIGNSSGAVYPSDSATC